MRPRMGAMPAEDLRRPSDACSMRAIWLRLAHPMGDVQFGFPVSDVLPGPKLILCSEESRNVDDR